MTNELAQLRKEINTLKKQKERKMQLSSSMQEREQLLNEINQLEQVKRNPNALQRFGKTFGSGLKTTGNMLWKGISRASSNLNRNAPEYKEFSKGMGKRQDPNSAPPDIDKMYVQRVQPYYSTTPRKMKVSKLKKRKMKKGKRGFRITDRSSNPLTWELP